MGLNVGSVLSAYKNTGAIIDDASAASAPSAAGGVSFADTLKGFVGNALDSVHDGEKASIDAVSGKASMATVATALDNAEIALDEMTTIRDKVIAAYQSVTTMAI